MLQLFAEEIWTTDGPTVTNLAFDFPTRMIVIRLSDGALFIWSPITLSAMPAENAFPTRTPSAKFRPLFRIVQAADFQQQSLSSFRG